MLAVASLLSIALFLAFVTAGSQKVAYNSVMSATATRLGFSRRTFQIIGVAEIVGGVAVMVGLAAHRSTVLGILNEAAAAGLAVTMALALFFHLRHGDGWRVWSPALLLGLGALVELVLRLA